MHWLTVSVGIHKNNNRKCQICPEKKNSTVCDSYLQGNSAVTVQCLCVSPSPPTKKKKNPTKRTIIWTANSIWDVDTVLNKLLCTVEPKAIATLFSGSVLFKWTNESKWEMLEKCITSQEHKLLCRFLKRHFYWMHKKKCNNWSWNHCFCLVFCFYCPLSCVESRGFCGCLCSGITLFSPSCAASLRTYAALQVWHSVNSAFFPAELKASFFHF